MSKKNVIEKLMDNVDIFNEDVVGLMYSAVNKKGDTSFYANGYITKKSRLLFLHMTLQAFFGLELSEEFIKLVDDEELLDMYIDMLRMQLDQLKVFVDSTLKDAVNELISKGNPKDLN